MATGTATAQLADAVRGKRLRFDWREGPTKGARHDHYFRDDGSVEFRDANATADDKWTREKEYSAVPVSDDVYLVSYLGSAGYTLTVALNFKNKRMVGIASGAKDWHPVEGTFEVTG
jgi:phenolic acid decarboxylase